MPVFGGKMRKLLEWLGLTVPAEDPDFSPQDLALIRMIPNGTIGNGTILPSGLKTGPEIISLIDDFATNVELIRRILIR